MSKVYPIRGAFWPQDRWGCVLNAAAKREDLALDWSVLAELACDLAQERFNEGLHSVYLSGSAARNRPGGGSFVIVLRPNASYAGATGWAAVAASELRRNLVGVDGVKVTVLRWTDVFASRNTFTPARFRLAVNSVCVAGRDLRRLVPAPPINAAAANTSVVMLNERLSAAKQKTLTSENRSRMRHVSADVGHAIISAAYATVMVDEQLYTEDLDLRRDLFVLNHPELTNEAQRAYDMAAMPGSDPVQIRAFINASREWLSPLIDNWLNQHNPDRLELLKT